MEYDFIKISSNHVACTKIDSSDSFVTSQVKDCKKMQKKHPSFFHLFCVTLYAALIGFKGVDGARICS
jgi:hypothetical protein